MGLISVTVPIEVHTFFAILNAVACFVFLTLRVYHQKIVGIKLSKISITALLCMLAAFFQCLVAVSNQTEWYFGSPRYCDLSMKLTAACWTAHRALLYMFIILRSEIVNHMNIVEKRIIKTSKVIIAVTGVFMVTAAAIWSHGKEDDFYLCRYEINNELTIAMVVVDISVCVAGTWLFIRPLRQILRVVECENLRNILSKMTLWTTVSIISTLLTILTVSVIDGAAGVVGFDCSITSFCLLMMMLPEKSKVVSKNNNHSSEKEVVEISRLDPVNHPGINV